MDRQEVDSSNLHSVGYDADRKLLEIQFNGGEVYEYYQVPPETYESLMKADSKGRYHHQNIGNMYEYKRVR